MGFGWKDFNSDLILLWFCLGNFSLETRENDKKMREMTMR